MCARAAAPVSLVLLALVASQCLADSESVVVLRSDNVVVGVGTARQPLRINMTISETSHIPLLTLHATCGRPTGDGWALGDSLCDGVNTYGSTSAKRFVVYVRASHHWERNVNFRMWRNLDPGVFTPTVEYFGSNPARLNITDRPANEDDGEGSAADGGFAALEPRTEITKSCSELLDECVITKYMTYTRSFKYVPQVVAYDRLHPEESVFRHRMACRVDGAEWGMWNLRVGNNLPHDATTIVEVIVVFQDHILSTFLLIPLVLVAAVLFCAVCAAVLLALKLFGQRRQRVSAETARREQLEALRLQQAVLRQQVLRGSSTHNGGTQESPQRAEAEDRDENGGGTSAPGNGNAEGVQIAQATETPEPTPTDVGGGGEATTSGARPPTSEELAESPSPSVSGWGRKLSCLVKGWRSAHRRQLLVDGDAEELTDVPSSGAEEPAEAEDEADLCRICRCAEPRESLFSPCRCNGSSRFVHRECLARWRASTSNPEHRRVCAECKAPYRIVQRDVLSVSAILHGIGNFARSAGKGIVTLGSLFVGGYILKLWFLLMTWDTSISWSALHPYHLALGLFLLVALVAYYNVMYRYIDAYPPRFQQFLVLAAVLLTVPLFGYLGQFAIYLIGHTVWTWEVCFGCGLATAYIAQANVIAVMLRAVERYNIVTDEVADRDERPPAAPSTPPTLV